MKKILHKNKAVYNANGNIAREKVMKKSQNESQPPARTSESRQSDMRELAAAMNNLANALRETNALAAQAKAEDPNWQKSRRSSPT